MNGQNRHWMVRQVFLRVISSYFFFYWSAVQHNTKRTYVATFLRGRHSLHLMIFQFHVTYLFPIYLYSNTHYARAHRTVSQVSIYTSCCCGGWYVLNAAHSSYARTEITSLYSKACSWPCNVPDTAILNHLTHSHSWGCTESATPTIQLRFVRNINGCWRPIISRICSHPFHFIRAYPSVLSSYDQFRPPLENTNVGSNVRMENSPIDGTVCRFVIGGWGFGQISIILGIPIAWYAIY